MAIDRAATIKRAESLLAEGKLDAAIQEYVRLIEEQPSDWSAGNMLGDLYVRAGEKDKAATLFTQIADSQYEQGFVAKATAFYKKALKVKSGDEQSLLRLAEIAAKQELMADARLYLGQLLQRRRDRGDDVGVTECLKRLAALEPKAEAPPVVPPQAAEAPQPPAVATPEPPPVATLEVERFEQTPLVEPAVQELSSPPESGGRLAPVEASSVSESADLAAQPEPPAVAEVAALTEPPALVERLEPSEPAERPATPLAPVLDSPSRPFTSVDLMALLDEMPELEIPELGAPIETVTPPVASVSAVPNVPAVPSVSTASSAPADANVPNVLNAPNVRTVSADMKARFEEMLARSRQARPVEVPPAQKPHDGADETGGDVVAQLEAAALTPSLEFQASAQLGRLLIERGELQAGIEWLERAARAPIQVPEHATAVLYEMAEALERMGDTARALAVLTDIESDVGSYRDVRERIDRLTRAQAGGRSA